MNKKGFTLVELLATILIIAILSLVSIPAINLVIKSIKKSSFKQNAVSLLKVVQLDRNNSGRTNDTDVSDEYIIDMTNNAITLNNEKIQTDYNGEINGKGIIRIDEAERMSILYSDGEYCAYKLYEETNVSIVDGDCANLLAAQCEETSLNVVPDDQWSQYKIVGTNFTGGICGELFYSKNNKGYQRYTGQMKIEENNTLITLKTVGLDGVEKISEKNITKIDRTAPTSINVTVVANAKKIHIKAAAEDSESGISVYAFSIDGGQHWTNYSSKNEYIYENPASGTYRVMAKAYNGTYGSTGATEELGEKISGEQVVTIESCPMPTYSVNPDDTSWTQSKTVTIDYHNSNYTDCVGSYSLDGGTTWQSGTSVLLSAPGHVVAKTEANPRNATSASTLNIIRIDNVAPITVDFNYTRTTNSITINPSATDNESNIWGYEFYLDGTLKATKSVTELSTTNGAYTIENIDTSSKNTFEVQVVAINNAYNNSPTSIKNRDNGTKASEIKTVTMLLCSVPTYSYPDNNGSIWTQEKTVAINYGNVSGCLGYYSTDGGTTWKTGTNAIFTDNGNLVAKNTDGTNTVTASVENVTKIDTTAPTAVLVSSVRRTNSLEVTASTSDSESGIYGYQFSSDGGSNWSAVQASNKYTFNLASSSTYTIKVKAINNAYNNTIAAYKSDAKGIKLSDGFTPTPLPVYKVEPSGWVQAKKVTISAANASGYTIAYSITGSEPFTNGTSVFLTSNGNVTGKVYKQDSEAYSSQTVTGIDTTAPTKPTFTYTTSTNKITIVPSSSDSESGIWGFEFYLDGVLKETKAMTSGGTYTFSDNVTTGNHKVKVVAINNAYTNTLNNSLISSYKNETTGKAESDEVTISIPACPTPVISYPNNDATTWKTSKVVNINYGSVSSCTGYYSTDGGMTWNTGTSVTFTSNGTIVTKNTDGTNTVTTSSAAVSFIDPSAPIVTQTDVSKTTRSIIVSFNASDSESGISSVTCRYGTTSTEDTTWKAGTITNTATGKYTCSFGNSLASGTKYYYKLQAVNGASTPTVVSNNTDSTAMCTPVITVDPDDTEWSHSKTGTITGSASGAYIQYQLGSSTGTWINYSSPFTINQNTTIYARCTDGLNTSSPVTKTITSILKEATQVYYNNSNYTDGDITVQEALEQLYNMLG